MWIKKTGLGYVHPENVNSVIWKLAWPAILEFALQTMVQYVDLFMVGHLGDGATAIVGVAAQVQFVIKFPIVGMSVGILAYAAKAVGERDFSTVKKISMQTAYMVLLIGLPATFATLLLGFVLPEFLNIGQELRTGFLEYYLISYATLLLFTASAMFSAVLRAAGHMKVPMCINAAVNVINIVLNAIFIYPASVIGMGKMEIHIFGFGMGLNGSALGSAVAVGIGGLLMCLAVYKNDKVSMKTIRSVPDFILISRMLRVGIPAAASSIVTGFGRLVFTSYVADLGTAAMAAHAIAYTVEGFFYIPAVGFGKAASVLAGNCLGEQNLKKMKYVVKASSFMAGSLMLAACVLLFVFAEFLSSFFTLDAGTAALSGKLLRIIAFSEPIFAVSLILEGGFYGMGDTRIPFFAETVSMWVFRVLLSFFVVSELGFGITYLWGCMVADNVCRAVLLAWNFHQKDWKKKFSGA